LVAPRESPGRTIRSGTVVQAGFHRGLGQFMEVRHSRSTETLYAHLDAVAVAPGARVRQGEIIGRVGKSGNARHRWITPHLHFEVLRNGEPMDPQALGLTCEMAGGALTTTEESADASGGE
jgi:murein DD-endopeptidase MepM/ murein hydrolase activator NlpD